MIWVFLYIGLSILSVIALVVFESLFDPNQEYYDPNYVFYTIIFLFWPIFWLVTIFLYFIWLIVKVTRSVITVIKSKSKDSEQKKFEKERDIFLS